MILLLDTDVLIDVALQREPFIQHSSKILDLAEQNIVSAYIAWHSVSNFYYIVKPKSKKHTTADFIKEILQFVTIAPIKTKDAIFAASLNIKDLEGALQIAAAKACNAEMIITRNIKHYKSSPIKAVSPKLYVENIIH